MNWKSMRTFSMYGASTKTCYEHNIPEHSLYRSISECTADFSETKTCAAMWIFFTQIEQPQHELHKHLPKPKTTTYNTRCRTRYSLPRVKTNRTKNCFINWCLFNPKNSQTLNLNLFFRSNYFDVLTISTILIVT